jgi:hypothetical protein
MLRPWNAALDHVVKDIAQHVREECWIEPLPSDDPILIDGEQINRILVIVCIDLASIDAVQVTPSSFIDEDFLPQTEVFLQLISVYFLIIFSDNMYLCHRMLCPPLLGRESCRIRKRKDIVGSYR